MLSSWKNWCRLCACETAALKIESVELINSIIIPHLQVSISEIEDAPLFICEECYIFVNKLERFKERCEQTNRLFTYLYNCSNLHMQVCDVEEVRSRYLGVLDVDDAAEGLHEELEAESPDLMNLLPLSGIEHHEDEDQEIMIKVETLDVPINPNDPEDGASDTEQWEPDDLEYEDVECELEPKDEKLSEDISITDTVLVARNVESVNVADKKSTNNVETLPKLRGTQGSRSVANKRQSLFQCFVCSKKFSSSSYLKKHEATHLPDGEKELFPCSFCDKMFCKAINVRAHIRLVHEGEKPFICEECGKPFGSKGALKEHYIVHTDDRPYQCSQCTKRFKNAARLKTHEDTHKDTLYVCPHCGLKLNTKRTLNMHMVVHSDQKKYKCQYCGNEYKRSKALKAHLILHTGLRPYLCPFCDRTFANGSNCRSHKKKFHPLELAALEAAGGQKPASNIPKLEHLQPKSLDEAEEADSKETVIEPPTEALPSTDYPKRVPKRVSQRTLLQNSITVKS